MTKIEDLQQQVTDLEAMLTHASDTIARLEGRWRSPGAFVKEGTKALVIEPRTLNRITAEFSNDEWASGSNCDIDILAWCELPPIPSDEMFAELI